MTGAPPAGPLPPGRPADAPPSGRAGSIVEGLGFRLSSLFAFALMPLGIVSLLGAMAWLDASRQQAAAALVGETLEAASREARLIHAAQGIVLGLSETLPSFLGDEAACDAVMDAVVAGAPHLVLASFVPDDGRLRCASGGTSFDLAGNPRFEAYRLDPRPLIAVNPRGPVSGTSVITINRPVRDPAGGYLGAVSLSLPHAALSAAAPAGGAPSAGPPEGAPSPAAGDRPDLITFAPDGTVLTASVGLDRAGASLPQGVDLSARAGPVPTTFAAAAAGGEERVYAVAELIPGELYALGSVPARRALVLGGVPVVAPFLLAALMWGGSLVVAWLAAERLVTRHMRRLARAIGSFASGGRVVGDLDMARAPAEIREVSHAFQRMTDAILHDEAELEDIVHQKEVLLREVHHRVKNNLQLIASIMNMQMRRARSPETRALMLGLQERVMSLATVHKELYQTTGLADVRADELLGDITRQILAMASAPGRRFQVATDFAPLRLTPDQAVPLSLLLTEALTNAIKHAEPRPGERAPRLALTLATVGSGRVALAVANSAAEGPPPAPEDGSGLGGQLIAAFAAQLGGEVTSESRGGEHVLRLEFGAAPLEGGEARHPRPADADADAAS